VRRRALVGMLVVAMCGLTALGAGCGDLTVFNPEFLNTTTGGVFPLTPGPGAAFVLVRTLNETGDVAEFTITIERENLSTDENGLPQFDEFGNPVTVSKRETVRLTTFPIPPANEAGVLFSCSPSPVNIVGLGENLLPSDAAVFIGGQGAGGLTGTGVTAADVNPLSREAGNFNCGDTIIFRAFTPGSVAGGTVTIRPYLLPGSEQPSIFTGPDTFVNAELLIESIESSDD
jgi:hypothetical protein